MSLLTGELLRMGHRVAVVDELMFGGQSLLACLPYPNFHTLVLLSIEKQ